MSSLTANHLVKKFRNKTVLSDVSIAVNSHEIVGLLGANGAGKTTCFYVIVGQIRPDYGTIQMNGEDLSALPVHRRARLGLAYLPQEKSIFTDLTAAENIQAVLEIRGRRKANECRRCALAILEEMDIGYLANAAAHTLSGGERRRVEIARLLALQPSFILMDEPFAAIAPIAVKDLQKIIFSMRDRGIGIFITDHNVRETLQICDRAYLLDKGHVLVEGTPEYIITNETAKHVYLGHDFGI